MRVIYVSALLLIGANACGDPQDLEQLSPQPLATTNLSTALNTQELNLVGIAVEASSGRRFILDANLGLYELMSDGSAQQLYSVENMPQADVEVQLPFTDMTSLGDAKLAITAIGDGFILDLSRSTLTQHFCYVPPIYEDEPWPEDLVQQTSAVTYDHSSDRIIAQPQTIDTRTGTRVRSEVAFYDGTTGDDLEWVSLPTAFEAGGSAIVKPGVLVLGQASTLFTLSGRSFAPLVDLEKSGIQFIEGLAYDSFAKTLLVLDGHNNALVEFDTSDLAL